MRGTTSLPLLQAAKKHEVAPPPHGQHQSHQQTLQRAREVARDELSLISKVYGGITPIRP